MMKVYSLPTKAYLSQKNKQKMTLARLFREVNTKCPYHPQETILLYILRVNAENNRFFGQDAIYRVLRSFEEPVEREYRAQALTYARSNP